MRNLLPYSHDDPPSISSRNGTTSMMPSGRSLTTEALSPAGLASAFLPGALNCINYSKIIKNNTYKIELRKVSMLRLTQGLQMGILGIVLTIYLVSFRRIFFSSATKCRRCRELLWSSIMGRRDSLGCG